MKRNNITAENGQNLPIATIHIVTAIRWWQTACFPDLGCKEWKSGNRQETRVLADWVWLQSRIHPREDLFIYRILKGKIVQTKCLWIYFFYYLLLESTHFTVYINNWFTLDLSELLWTVIQVRKTLLSQYNIWESCWHKISSSMNVFSVIYTGQPRI